MLIEISVLPFGNIIGAINLIQSSCLEIVGSVALTIIGSGSLAIGHAFYSERLQNAGKDYGREAVKWIKNGTYYLTLAAVNILSLGILGYIYNIKQFNYLEEELYHGAKKDLFKNLPIESLPLFGAVSSTGSLLYNICKAVYSFVGTIFFVMGKIIGFNTSDYTKLTLTHLKASMRILPLNLLNIASLGTLAYLLRIEEANKTIDIIQKRLNKAQIFPILGLACSVVKGVLGASQVLYGYIAAVVYGIAIMILPSKSKECIISCIKHTQEGMTNGYLHLGYSLINLATLGIAGAIIENTINADS
ncbi:MAG: hypothetical protein P4L16_03590 [Chlamydiales bacterium]|nr:hypothetical protein [Chlamydiales bacterium]